MRRRLERTEIVDYQVARSNDRWPDHRLRTLVTAAAIAWLRPDTIVDPACGDGSIVIAADRMRPIRRAMFADVSEPNITYLATAQRRPGWEFYRDDIVESLGVPGGTWDAIVLTETLEHLPDPDGVLRLARSRGKYLVASSPVMRSGQHDHNPEHLWMFNREGYEEMLTGAGWSIEQYTFLNFPTEYDFGIWVCK